MEFLKIVVSNGDFWGSNKSGYFMKSRTSVQFAKFKALLLSTMAILTLATLTACKAKFNNENGSSSEAANGGRALVPAPALALTTDHNQITVDNTLSYSVSGGLPPYVVSVDQGVLSSLTGSGVFGADGQSGVATLSVVDALGASATATVSIQSRLQLLAAYASQAFSRYAHSSTAIDGKLFVFGGINQDASLYVYDPSLISDGAWRKLTPAGTAPAARAWHAGVEIGGKLYIFGGTNGSGELYSDISVYDPTFGTEGAWRVLSPSGSAPAARSAAAAAVLNGKLYIHGGQSSAGVQSDFYVFDPAAGADGSWTSLSPTGTAPSARWYHQVVAMGGKLYLFGKAYSGIGTDIHVYDPSAGGDGTWSVVSPAGDGPWVGGGASLVTFGGKLYHFGGYTQSGGHNGTLNDFFTYDPSAGSSGTWARIAPTEHLPTPRYGQTITVIAGLFYLIGGDGQNGDDVYAYDPATGQWIPRVNYLFGESVGLNGGDSLAYLAIGGVAPLQVSAVSGSLSSNAGSGSYTLPVSIGTVALTVTDAIGNTSVIQVHSHLAPQSPIYFHASTDAHWGSIGNWWADANHTVLAGRIPLNGDLVYMNEGDLHDDYAPALQLTAFIGALPSDPWLNYGYASGLSIVSGGTLTLSAGDWGGSAGAGSTVRLSGNAGNYGTISGDASFYGSSRNLGVVEGAATFFESSENQGQVVGACSGAGC